MKSTNLQSFVALIAVFLLSHSGFAQSLQEKDSIVLSAMKDELHNNMDNLHEEGFDKPFFMAYTITDMQMKLATAAYGAEVFSRQMKNRDWNTRIMVGDYDVNDENFSDYFQGASKDNFYETVPIDYDYLGLRRVLWASTNNVYKSAARLYKQKQKTIADYEIDYQLADFSKEKPNTYIEEEELPTVSEERLNTLVAKISQYIEQLDSVYVNTAMVTDLSGRRYYYNSEGTTLVTNHRSTQLSIGISLIDSEGNLTNINLNYTAEGLDDIPSIDLIKQDIDWKTSHAVGKTDVPELEEDYNGPVLLEGRAVATLFINKLLRSGKGLFAYRKSFNNKDEQTIRRFFEQLDKDLKEDDDLKTGNKQLTVTSYPFMKEFDGQELTGSYQIDAEGVVPPEKLVLIQNGMIVQKLNGRIPAPNAQSSTGSNRFVVNANGVGKAIVPGVLKVEFAETMSTGELFRTFEKEIVDNDETRGVVINKAELNHPGGPVLYQFYNVEDGSRESFRKASFNWRGKNNLKKIEAVSDEYYVYNFRYSGNSYGNSSGGAPVSIIVPKYVIIRDMDISKSNYKGVKPDNIVPIPTDSE